MIKIRIRNNGIARSYHLDGKIVECFNESGEYEWNADAENELEALKDIINTSVGCRIEMIEEGIL